MTRCVACDKNLNDFESTRKVVRPDKTFSYPDLCNHCFEESGLRDVAMIVERPDLAKTEDFESEYISDNHLEEM